MLLRVLGFALVSMLVGGAIDVSLVIKAFANGWKPYAIPLSQATPLDLTGGHPFTLKQAGVMLSYSAFSYELKYEGVSDLRNGPNGSKIVTMHYRCTDSAFDHTREHTGTVSYVRAEIEGGWMQSNLMPLRTACR
jgi:hypothetical protein